MIPCRPPQVPWEGTNLVLLETDPRNTRCLLILRGQRVASWWFTP